MSRGVASALDGSPAVVAVAVAVVVTPYPYPTGLWNALPDPAMVPTSSVGGGVNDALSWSLLTRDELLETLLICPDLALPAAPFA